jgi:hypothetical protein
MVVKKYMALAFCLGLVVLLFYCGINLAEQGSKSLLGVEEPPRAFRVLVPADARGEVEIYWSGKSRRINISFITDAAGGLKNRLQSLWQGSVLRGSKGEGGEDL